MSSTRSSNSPMAMPAEEEPRKKGARGGKRSVTHLSKAQLARKRANDREAQRNIRQRTKEHIENLERKVKELEGGGRSQSMERVLQRNRELEAEVERLKAQVVAQQVQTQTPSVAGTSEVSEELLVPQKLEWTSEPAWQKTTSPAPQLEINTELRRPNTTYPPPDGQIYTPTPSSMGYDESSQPMYSASGTPLWEQRPMFGPATSQSLSKPIPAWSQSPFPPSSQPSHFVSHQKPGFSNPNQQQQPFNTTTTCWQSQPSVYAWQMSTKLKAPTTFVDQLMFSVIHSQRHLAITADLTGEDIIGPAFPSVHLLFNQPGPVPNKHHSAITDIMAKYSAVLSNRGFALIPEKLASFMCMYRFVQWQISPTYSTYKRLHEWQAPRPSQLMIPHPAWMDLPPWGKFRDKVIENQDKYDNVEFQTDYVRNLSVNFGGDPMKALVFENGGILVGKVLEDHVSNIDSISMKRGFADKYPEFADSCRFEEV